MDGQEPLRHRVTGEEMVPRYEELLRQLAAHMGIEDDHDEWVLDLSEVINAWQAARELIADQAWTAQRDAERAQAVEFVTEFLGVK